jgi:hypothetical protein
MDKKLIIPKKEAPITEPESPAKRTYCTDVRKKLNEGKKWKLHIVVEDDNAKSILNDVEKSIAGGDYQKLINNIIRLHYKKAK